MQSLLECAIVLKHPILTKMRNTTKMCNIKPNFYDFLTSGTFMTSVNIASQMDVNFYDAVGKIESFLFRKYITDDCHDWRFLLMPSVNMKLACVGQLRMLDFVFICYQSLIFSELLFISV